MRSQTIKFAKARLDRFEAQRVYSYSGFNINATAVGRVGVYGRKV